MCRSTGPGTDALSADPLTVAHDQLGVDARRPVDAPARSAARPCALGPTAPGATAAVLFGVVTATHHPAVFVAGVVLGIMLAGLTTTAVTFLFIQRTLRLRPVFAFVLAGEVPAGRGSLGQRTLRTGPRLLVSWALGSGIALVAIAVAPRARRFAR